MSKHTQKKEMIPTPKTNSSSSKVFVTISLEIEQDLLNYSTDEKVLDG